MNPYTFANLLRPTIQPDYRDLQNNTQITGLAYSLSHTIYRIIRLIDRLP